MNEYVRVLDCALFVGGQETFTIIILRVASTLVYVAGPKANSKTLQSNE